MLDFNIGDTVIAVPWEGDLFEQFEGTVSGYEGEYILVEDRMGGEEYCYPEQLTKVD